MIGVSNQLDKVPMPSAKEEVPLAPLVKDSSFPTVDHLKRYQLLSYGQVERLRTVMETSVPIHGTGNFPTLDITPSFLVHAVKKRVEDIGVKVVSIRLNGSAATHVLSENDVPNYKDLDLIFQIDNSQPPLPPRRIQQAKLDYDCVIVDDDQLRPQRPPYLTKQRSKSEDAVSVIEDSGYASSESISSYPPSPSEPTLPDLNCNNNNLNKNAVSISSTSAKKQLSEEDLRSISASLPRTYHHHSYLPPVSSYTTSYSRHQQRGGADNCWERIKDAVMDALLDYLPPRVSRERMCSSMLANAYVQKKVKVTNERDQWSLISLNNNTGRNLELKFVQSMNRQYEFSVDSFQIELATFLEFRRASRHSANTSTPVEMNKRFYPTVLAESVYGDFHAALRHLRHRRICTYRPEEIRGGGLLRYCNLRVRKYRPGDCDDRGRDVKNEIDDGRTSSKPEEVARLEQHMCSRFFIDFGSIQYQSKKLVNYLDNRFAGEDDLKLEYLIMLRSVVSTRTVCLMQHELKLILDHITQLVRQTLANNIARSSPANNTNNNNFHTTNATTSAQQMTTNKYCEFYYHPIITSDGDGYFHHHHHPTLTPPPPPQHCYLATSTLLPPSPSDRSSPMSVQSNITSARSSPEPTASSSMSYSRPPSAPPIDGYYANLQPQGGVHHHIMTSHHYPQHQQQCCQMSGQHVCCYCGCYCCCSIQPSATYNAYIPQQQYHHMRNSSTPSSYMPPPSHINYHHHDTTTNGFYGDVNIKDNGQLISSADDTAASTTPAPSN